MKKTYSKSEKHLDNVPYYMMLLIVIAIVSGVSYDWIIDYGFQPENALIHILKRIREHPKSNLIFQIQIDKELI